MTETMHIEIPVVVDFDFQPADPSVGRPEHYEVKAVYTGGTRIIVPLMVEADIIRTLQDTRERLIREARAYVSMPRAQHKEALR